MERVGDVAGGHAGGVPVKTIRYYDDIGVLPAPARTPSGYRDYDDRAVDQLAFVRAGQSVGLTLGEIREIIALRDRGQTPCAHVADLVQRRAVQIQERIAALVELQDELQRLARRAQTLDPADCDPRLVCHLIGPTPHTPDPLPHS